MIDYTIIIQAGGRSSRMGTDKAMVPFMGTTMLGYVLEQIKPLGKEVLLISNDQQSHSHFGLPIFGDIYPDWGALGGLHTAISVSRKDWCLVLACDMPFVQPGLVDFLANRAPGFDAVIPRISDQGFTEPFRALYHKKCLHPVEQAINEGRRRVNSFFDSVNINFLDQNAVKKIDPELRSFFNVNTPEDLALAEAMAK